jgi:formamidopyrimidine-DNA glycosylase
VERRGKYLLLRCAGGTLLIHLGMTGHLRLVTGDCPAGRYDRLDLSLESGRQLRLSDPRKFATVLWLEGDPYQHPLLSSLGPEPLTEEFSPALLFQRSRNRKVAIKPFIMDSTVVVGVGNIYASESLFRAAINPALPAGQLTEEKACSLAAAIKQVLAEAITRGGTTLHDYLDSEGSPGYFRLELRAYGRSGEPCTACGTTIQKSRLGGRSTFWCPVCQPEGT